MSEKILMTLSGSKLLTNSWKQELQIREDGVYGEILVVGKRTQTLLPYENIVQVNITRNIMTADMTIVNKGGIDSLTVKALSKDQADKGKKLIQQKIAEANAKPAAVTHVQAVSGADEIAKLSELKEKGILTDEEFQAKKKQILEM